VRWVVAVKDDSPIERPADPRGQADRHRGGEPHQAYLRKHGVSAHIEFSWGATEVKPPLLADAIVDVTETGSSLRANNLRVIDTVLESTPRFIAQPRELCGRAPARGDRPHRAAAARRDHARPIASADDERAAREARRRCGRCCPRSASRPCRRSTDDRWVAVNTVIQERLVKELLPRLREAGARGIVEYPLSKIIE
jgi:ATP phosphoribosyltransferase